MKDLFDKVLATVYERTTSPFLSSALLSWPIVNYKIILVLLSSENYTKKIEYIEKLAYTPDEKIWNMLLIPLFIGIFYSIIYPLFDIILSGLILGLENVRAWMQLRIKRKHPIDREMRDQYFSGFDVEIERARERLKQVLDQEEKTRTKLNKEIGSRQAALKRMCRRRLQPDLAFPAEAFDWAMQDAGAFSELGNHREITEAIKTGPIFGKMKIIAHYIVNKKVDRQGRILTSKSEVAGLFMPEGCPWDDNQMKDVEELLDVSIGLGWLTELPETPGQYETSVGTLPMWGRLSSL